MQVSIIAVGSRGDVQPIIALGKGLHDAGYRVRVIAGENFESFITEHGLEFASLGVDMVALMQTDTAQKWVDSNVNGLAQIRHMRTMMEIAREPMTRSMWEAVQDADVIVPGLLTEVLATSVAEARGAKAVSALLQPFRLSGRPEATMIPYWRWGSSFLNRWSTKLAQRVMWPIFQNVTNAFREKYLNLPPYNFADYQRALRELPTLYGFSRHVIPHSSDLPPQVETTGYWFLDLGDMYTPPASLNQFLDHGPAPVYIGFGSMAGRNQQQNLEIALEALHMTGQRGVIVSGWSEFDTVELPDTVYMLNGAPHDWLFPRMAAVVHHGGSGTTGAALRSGLPSMIIPHLGDQDLWGRRVHELGVGAKPVPRPKLTAKALALGIDEMMHNTGMQQRAALLGAAIREEDGVQNAVRAFERFTAPVGQRRTVATT
jgi:sterol 3beta-glucosyltransferase